MATLTPFQVISHTRRVCSIYKKCLRSIQDYTPDRAEYRYRCALLRAEFDKNRDVKDINEAVALVEEAEQEEYQKRHYQPFKFVDSPGGVAHGRFVTPPDWVLDFWDPVEKACYPNYFKVREQRKKEYIDFWVKKYGKVDPEKYKHAH